MERIARILVRHSRRVLAATGLVSLVAALMFLRMDFNADISRFITEGNPVGESWVALQEKYDAADPINVLVSLPPGESFRTKTGLVTLAGLREQIAALEGVRQVGSVVPDRNPLTGAPLTAAVLAQASDPIVEAMLAASPVADLLIAADGRHSLLMVVPDGDAVEVTRRLEQLAPPPGAELVLSGNPVIFASVLSNLSWFLLVIPPAVIILLLATFYTNIGDRRLTALSIVPAALGALWTFGFIFGLGREVDIVTVIVPIFVIVMGSADGLHFVAHYQEAVEHTADRVERVASTLRQVGLPMILTTISTSAGFLSLLAADVRPIRQMGVFTAVGIGFAGIISFFTLPALMSRLDVQPRHHQALLGPRVTSLIKQLARRRWVAAALAAGLLAFTAIFIVRLEVTTDQLFFFKDGDPVRLAFDRTAEVFGGASPMMGEFVYDPAAGPDQLAALAAVEDRMESLPGVRTVFSLADLAGVLPPDQIEAALRGEVALPLGAMASGDGLRFLMFTESFTTADLRGWVAFTADQPEVRVLTGLPVLWDEIARLVLRAQIGSLAAAFVLVAAMLLISYRRLRETLVSLVPIALTVGTLLAFIAASDIQLHLVTAIASSIVIGVGIDYAIHLVAAVDHARAEGEGFSLRAIDKAGRPIIANALGIAVGLTGLWLSPFRFHPQISMIMWVSMLTAALTTLLIIPALLPATGLRAASGRPSSGAPSPA